jgi:hypothetical protein
VICKKSVDQAFGMIAFKICMVLLLLLSSVNSTRAEELGVEEVINPGNGESTIPVDGGVSLLLFAAAGLGAYRTAQRRK